MAGRPRLPSNVLELRGAFKKHPERRRRDAQGTGEFKTEPPAHLPAGAVPAWNYLVTRLPKIALTSSDEIAVEIAARLLAQYWLTSDIDTMKELRQWLGKLGMTPADRTKMPSAPPNDKNPFSGL
jgi:phage terminase small subunit